MDLATLPRAQLVHALLYEIERAHAPGELENGARRCGYLGCKTATPTILFNKDEAVWLEALQRYCSKPSLRRPMPRAASRLARSHRTHRQR